MQLEKFQLKDKTALITGAGGLLGFEHAMALLEVDANIVLTDIDEYNLQINKGKLEKFYPNSEIYSYVIDISSKISILDALQDLKRNKIYVDILINNAAINPKVNKDLKLNSSPRFENFSIDEWNKQIQVGLTGAFLCSQIFGTEMSTSKRGGCILNIASDLSVIAPDQRIYRKDNLSDFEQPVKPVTYSVIKTGLVGLTKYLATYWINSNIRCNSLSPGGVYTDQPNDFVDKLSSLIPLGRMAFKDEYRSAIQFLCSEASSYMNGHNLVIDGGRSIW